MKIYENQELEIYKTKNLAIQSSWNERDFVNIVRKYFNSSLEKILAIGGLRGTGKTVGILQAATGYDVAYLLAQRGESETGQDYVRFLKTTKKDIIVIDEYSWIKDRRILDEYLLTSVQNGKRIVLTATESITLEFLNYSTLNHRVQTIHTTMFTYEEYLRLYNRTHSKSSCRDFLLEGGLFKDYILNNFDSTKDYINDAIVKNLAGYLQNEISEEKAKTLTYAVLYKAICPSNLARIPELRENHVTLDNYLTDMGVNTTYIPENKDIMRVADIFEQAGIIVRIPNFNQTSELREQYYITNPSMTCQLIKGVYNVLNIENSILGHVFESSVAVQLFTNKLLEHNIYFYNNGAEKNNPKNQELDLIITDKEQDFAYFFECKFRQKDTLGTNITLLSGYLEEHEFKDMEIEGRYVVYNGIPSVKNYDVGTIVFTPIGNILDNYFDFDKNINDISQTVNNDIIHTSENSDLSISPHMEEVTRSFAKKAKRASKNVCKRISDEKEKIVGSEQKEESEIGEEQDTADEKDIDPSDM